MVAIGLASAYPPFVQAATDAETEELLTRAQRSADRVKQLILQAAKINSRNTASDDDSENSGASQSKARRNSNGSVLIQRTKPASTASPTASPTSASEATDTSSAPSNAAESAKSVVHPKVNSVMLFNFETTNEGWALHTGDGSWNLVESTKMILTDEALVGDSALAVTAAEGGFLGQDFPEDMSWIGMTELTMWISSTKGFSRKVALKTGEEWGWCNLNPVPGEVVRNYTKYKMRLSDQNCPTLDLEMVRGIHIWVEPGDKLMLDGIEIR